MSQPKIEPHRITKPIQLMAVWFAGLVLIEAAFLTAASKITNPSWLPPALVISGIVFVPMFLVAVFLMQTVFRTELQEDQYYADYLKRKYKTFSGFQAENLQKPQGRKAVGASDDKVSTLEAQRVKRYETQRGLFLVHSWRPSSTPGQVADVVLWLHQHGKGPLTEGRLDRVEYQLGPKFFSEPQVKRNVHESFKIEVSAYGPMLCLARVYLKGEATSIEVERYVDFEEPL